MPIIRFHSSNHKRFEHDIQVSHDYVSRFVQLEYSPNGVMLTISIIPTLSPKQAIFSSDDGNVLVYNGLDPDYRFEIETKSDNTIRRVSVIRLDRNLELQFWE